jgi:hypothetical protein
MGSEGVAHEGQAIGALGSPLLTAGAFHQRVGGTPFASFDPLVQNDGLVRDLLREATLEVEASCDRVPGS